MTRERGLWLLLIAMIVLWYAMLPSPQVPVTQYVPAPLAPELKRIPTVPITPKKPVKAYSRPAKAALNLPPEVQANESIYVLGASKLAASERPRTIVTTLDVETGQPVMVVRNDPYPWLAAESRGALWVGVGMNGRLERVARAEASYDVLQVKAIHIGLRATVDTMGEKFVGVGAAYHFD